jgi:hypothetical protein
VKLKEVDRFRGLHAFLTKERVSASRNDKLWRNN